MKTLPAELPPKLIGGSTSDTDEYMMLRAFQVSKDSDDPKAAQYPTSGVGAVIANKRFIISESSNRLVPKIRGQVRLTDPTAPERYYYIEHAERCAIFEAVRSGAPLDGATMYCTRFPCVDCARAISYVGITRLVVPTGFASESKWIDAQRAALSLLRMSNIVIRYFDPR